MWARSTEDLASAGPQHPGITRNHHDGAERNFVGVIEQVLGDLEQTFTQVCLVCRDLRFKFSERLSRRVCHYRCALLVFVAVKSTDLNIIFKKSAEKWSGLRHTPTQPIVSATIVIQARIKVLR